MIQIILLFFTFFTLTNCSQDKSNLPQKKKKKADIEEIQLISLERKVNLKKAKIIKPQMIYSIDNARVTDFKVIDNYLYASSDKGILSIFDLKESKLVGKIELEKITDLNGKKIPARIYSFDLSQDQSRLIFSVEGNKGVRKIILYDMKSKIFNTLETGAQDFLVQKISFVDKSHIIFALLSNEIILYNIDLKKKVYHKKISTSSFSDYELVKSKLLIVASESGKFTFFDIQKGVVIKIFSGIHVDKVFKVDFKNGIISGAGQDRRFSITDTVLKKSFYINTPFLVYAGAINSDGSKAALSYNEDNEIMVLNVENDKNTYLLKGHESTLNDILFLSDEKILSSSEDGKIVLWSLKS